ncbi:EF-P lysine aminoacylase EpmA [Halofilum ochraceum]|uniref:EF-P lysine aminoacylase EpmA n=1 Tax=Halofilum ochraceum TaxID=1611323 RepID=UPI0008D8F0BC|nr:EF-P lysine aminoacylase EpmA [Halofilum ochraceum]
MTGSGDSGLWRPVAGADILRLRARMRGRLRAFFDASDVLEVDTPALSAAAPTEPRVEPVRARVLGEDRFLQTSPEFPMKRLLAAGVGDCWQLARVYRDGERGRWHQPEFDLLEWYRLGFDHHELMEEVEAVIAATLAPERPVRAAEYITYADAFRRHAGVDPLTAGMDELRAIADDNGLSSVPGLDDQDRDGWLDRLLTGLVAPRFAPDRLTFLYDWPASQAALARIDAADPRIAARFEAFWGELELANGFHELADAAEQRARFETENRARYAEGVATIPVDERMLAALEAGLPDCAGVALGFDRLVMLAAGADTIDAVLPFPFERA